MSTGPELLVLGTAQDGGLPHVSCYCAQCTAARKDPARARRVASLALFLPSSDRVFLVDATPDLRPQLDVVHDRRGRPGGGADRAPLDGVLLTHAHLGHYTGLAFFGFEALHTRALPVYCTPRMATFLRGNGPWNQLVTLDNIRIDEVARGGTIDLGDGVSVTVLAVPHRDEYSDTVGLRIEGPRSTVLYVPDTDGWERWDPPLASALQGVDLALLDGTFYSMGELPGRDMSQVRHPLITASMDLLEPLLGPAGLRVAFTHLNHSNPALDPDGPERAAIESRGFRILDDGVSLPL